MLAKIQEQMKASMKAKDELGRLCLRMLMSEFKYAQIEKRSPLDEKESQQVIQKAIKKTERGNRTLR